MHARRAALVSSAAMLAVSLIGAGAPHAGAAATSSNVITIGTLYASSGQFATSSMPEYQGLEFWAHHVDATGGVYVKATGKKEQVKIVSYNDESSTTTATTLYSRLITQNHVNMLVADFGSVLTANAVPIAKEHHVVLWDQSGSGTTFFTQPGGDHYIVLTSIQSSQYWPDSLSSYIEHNHLKRIAIVYGENDFTGAQNTTLVSNLKKAGIKPVYDAPVPTTTTTFSTILTSMEATQPQMIVELGYPNNDTAFFQALKTDTANKAKVFTVFPGQQEAQFERQIGKSELAGTYTYLAPPLLNVKNVNYGMTLPQFKSAFSHYSGTAASQIQFGDIMGYNTGLIMQKDLGVAANLSQNALRAAANTFSGDITTIEGTFKINHRTGSQVGTPFPVGRFNLKSNGQVSVTDYSYTIRGEK